MNRRRGWRLGAKAVHEIGSIGFGGGLAACLVINIVGDRGSHEAFRTARGLFAAIAQYVLLPSMAVVVVSGLLALVATRGSLDAGWAWVEALSGLSVLEATLMVVGYGQRVAGADPALLAPLLRSERNTLWLLLGVGVANVVLAVWRPRLTIKIPEPSGIADRRRVGPGRSAKMRA